MDSHSPATFGEYMQLARSVNGTVLVTYNRDLAISVLTKLNSNNRKMKSSNVESMARAMRIGEFLPDIQRIFIGAPDAEGECTLRNGQHTMEAVSKANCQVAIETRFGTPESYLKYIDTGASRSVADVGRLMYDLPYAAANTGVFRAYASLIGDLKTKSLRANVDDVHEFWLQNQEFLTMLHVMLNGSNAGNSPFCDDQGHPLRKVVGGISNASVKSALLLASESYPLEVRSYLKAFVCEEGAHWGSEKAPTLAKRRLTGNDEMKLGTRLGHGMLRNKAIQHVILKTLHMHVKNETARMLRLGNDDELRRYVNFFRNRPLAAGPEAA